MNYTVPVAVTGGHLPVPMLVEVCTPGMCGMYESHFQTMHINLTYCLCKLKCEVVYMLLNCNHTL